MKNEINENVKNTILNTEKYITAIVDRDIDINSFPVDSTTMRLGGSDATKYSIMGNLRKYVIASITRIRYCNSNLKWL